MVFFGCCSITGRSSFSRASSASCPRPGRTLPPPSSSPPIALTIWTYRRTRSEGNARHRAVLVAIRLATLLVVLSCLFRPVLVVKAAVPQQNFLGVLIDDSRSMQIADVDGQARSAFVKQHFTSPDGDVLKTLSSRFVLRNFRFSSTAQRLASPTELAFYRRADEDRRGARRRAAGARRPAAGGPRARDRRRRHDRRRARRTRCWR